MDNDKDNIINELRKVKRLGMNDLIKYLEESDFFDAPASTRYHYAFKGGLVKHCWSVFETFKKLQKMTGLDIPKDAMIILSLLHDVVKINFYDKKRNKYVTNKSAPKGHGSVSIERIEKFIKLTDIEKHAIKYHMGMYMCMDYCKECDIIDVVTAFNNQKISKLFHIADDLSANFMEK